MKKYFNRLLSLVIATVIILTFSAVPAFATGSDPYTWTPTSPDADNTMQTIRANYIEGSGVDVYAYQIVKGTYKDEKFTGYTICDGLASIPDIDRFDYLSPTSDWITKIANYIRSGSVTLASVKMEYTPGTVTYKSRVEAGEYIILVTDSSSTVYNPAIVAVNVTDANLLSGTGGTVDMRSQFSAGDTAYMKSSTSNFAKFAGRYPMNTASFGDAVSFRVTYMVFPSYSQDYTSVQYTITDDLYLDHSEDPPFLGVSGLRVKVDGSQVPEVTGEGAEAVTNYEVKYYKKNESTTGDPIVRTQDPSKAVKYEIIFTDAFIRANGMKGVEVTYSSTLTDNAQLALSDTNAFVSNDTRATLRYSNNPTDANSYSEKSSETHTYTFGIDSGEGGIQTYEFNKVNQAGGTYTSVLDNNDEEITKKSPFALAGATFTLYSYSAMTEDDIIGTATSDANGHTEFRGLGVGTYYIKETGAPTGYTLNNNNYKIVISAEEDFAGDVTGSYIKSYTIKTYLMGETDTQIGSAEYKRELDNTVDPPTYKITPTITPAEVVNTQLVDLPTTGGVGTIVISVVAGLGMAVFLTIFVISKKRSSKKLK